MKAVRDTGLVLGHYLKMTRGNPIWAIIGVVQPLMYLVLFAPLLTSVTVVRQFPAGGAYNVFVPGLVILLSTFSSTFAGFGLIAELREGVVERLRVTPASRVGLLVGRASHDLVILLLSSLLLMLVATPFGLRIRPLGLLLMLALQALMGLLMTTLSYWLALVLKEPSKMASVLTGFSLPLMLLSGALLPMSLAPAWLQDIARANPLYYAVLAARAIFNGDLGDPSVVTGVAIIVVLAVVTVLGSARSFGRALA